MSIFACVLKQAVPIILILVILFANVNKVWIFIDFKLNQDTITEELCENKAKPELACHGKCHLVKQLKAEEEHENKNSPRRLKIKSEVLFFNNDIESGDEKIYLVEKSHQLFLGKDLYQFSYFNQIFHPPQNT